ncbi:MAG: QueT transporter family protein [Desulfurococcaceae archaeon]
MPAVPSRRALVALLVAAVYAAATTVLGIWSYGPIQLRASDAMLVLPLFPGIGLEAVAGLTLGGLLGNIASPYQPWDLIFGPLSNFVVALTMLALSRPVRRFPGLFPLAAAAASLEVAILVGYLELVTIYGAPIITVPLVFVGEMIAVLALGGALVAFARRTGFPRPWNGRP